MSHELSIRNDGFVEMAFVGETPWHGLGQSVSKGASIGVWAKEAGMDWTAKEATPMYTAVTDDKSSDKRAASMSKVIYRSDTGEALSVMGSRYEIVQPKAVLEFFRDMTEAGGWHIHTAGCLRGGRKVWAMASNGSSADVNGAGKDKVVLNALLATSLDGSMKTTAIPTAVRVVCANTMAMAMQGHGKRIEISHRSVFDPNAIKQALGWAVDGFELFMHQAREMAETPVNVEEARDILRKLFPSQAATAKPDTSWMGKLSGLNAPVEQADSRVVEKVMALFEGEGMGAGLKTAKGTRWGLFNAVTEHVDHEMGRSDDTRLDAAWFGRGSQFKQAALEALTA